MIRFRVILTNAETGYDIYGNFIFEAEGFVELATRLNAEGVCYRVIERLHPAVGQARTSLDRFYPLTPWDTLPESAYCPVTIDGRPL